MEWAVGITAAPRLVDYLLATLASLRAAGWDRVTVFAEPGTPLPPGQSAAVSPRCLKPWQNCLRALRTLVDSLPAADAYVVFQDDVLVAQGCRMWLEGELWPDPLPGVLSLYVSEAQAEGRPQGWSRLDPDITPYGACAVVMPPGSARLLLREPPHREAGRMIDTWLGVFCERHGLPFYQHVPSLVRHIGRESSLARGGKRPIVRPWVPARHEGEWVADVAGLVSKSLLPYN